MGCVELKLKKKSSMTHHVNLAIIIQSLVKCTQKCSVESVQKAYTIHENFHD